VLNEHKPASVHLSLHTWRCLAVLATKCVQPMSGRMPLPEPLRRTGCSAHFQCASSSPVQRGLCYIGIGCTHPRGCRGVLSSTALGHVALHTRPPARRDPPLKAGHRSARAHFCADVVSDSDSRATRVCILEGRAEEMARLPESCGTAGSWITSCAPSRARRAEPACGERALQCCATQVPKVRDRVGGEPERGESFRGTSTICKQSGIESSRRQSLLELLDSPGISHFVRNQLIALMDKVVVPHTTMFCKKTKLARGGARKNGPHRGEIAAGHIPQ